MNNKHETTSANIIDSGVVITFKSESLKIKPKEGIEIELNFINKEEEGNSVKTEIAHNNAGTDYLKVFIYNVKNEGSMTEPLVIISKTSTRKEVSLSLYFKKLGESFLCNYTFFEMKN